MRDARAVPSYRVAIEGEHDMNNANSSTRNDIGLFLALGAGIGAALASAGMGAAGVALGIAGGLLVWALRRWSNRKS
jgi:hypothetical protein